MSLLTWVFGLVLGACPLWGLVLLFKTKAWLAFLLLALWALSAFYTYVNFSYGTQAAIGLDPTSLTARLITMASILLLVGILLYLVGFLVFHYWKF